MTTTHSQHTETKRDFERAFEMFARETRLRGEDGEAPKAEAELARREARFGTDPVEAADAAWFAYWAWAGEVGEEISRLRAAAASTTASERESSVRQIEKMQERLKQRDQEIQGAAERGYSLELKRIALELQKEAREWREARTLCSQASTPHAAPAEAHQEQDASASASKGSSYRPRGRKQSVAPALLVQILDALEGYAAATGQDFDRDAMPGPLGKSADDEGSFHWLCARLYSRTFKRAPDTFTKHRAGLCAVAPYAKATDFYRLALPHIAPKLGATLNVHHMPKQGRKSA